MSSAKYRGGCLCGDISIEIHAEPQLHANCHCTDCQQESGGPFFPNVIFPPGSVNITKGEPKLHDLATSSGNHARRYFCGRCGSSLYASVDALGKAEVVRLGVFSGPGGTGTSFYKPTEEFFVKAKQAWVKPVEGITQWQGMPK